jgi:hypothetical protein
LSSSSVKLRGFQDNLEVLKIWDGEEVIEAKVLDLISSNDAFEFSPYKAFYFLKKESVFWR